MERYACEGGLLEADGCWYDLGGPSSVRRYEREAWSFGQRFIAHAYLCTAHARELGWAPVKEPA